MEGKFYPATPLGEFDDIHAALESVGVRGHYADVIVAEMDSAATAPSAYRCAVNGEDGPDDSALVIVPLEGDRVAIYLGFPSLLADSRDGALMLAAEALLDAALAGEFEEPPVINAFQWHAPRTVLQ
ncbi:hypothetical protein PQQ96_40880 [Paraburkholderia sediminicola]|uniref:hypothetical protein n=1 Tax=Paraburkholderia sediminicola TaxID=458836 RepID=UPI0038BB7134